MAYGRPRTNCPPKNKVIQLGKELVQWASEPSEQLRCRFCQWYTMKGFIRREWEKIIEKPEFRVYYEKAQSLLGQRLLDGSVNPSMAHRIAWHYLPEVKEQELAKIKAESEARKAEIKEQAKLIFKVNYPNDSNNTVQIPSEAVSTPNSKSTK